MKIGMHNSKRKAEAMLSLPEETVKEILQQIRDANDSITWLERGNTTRMITTSTSTQIVEHHETSNGGAKELRFIDCPKGHITVTERELKYPKKKVEYEGMIHSFQL
ncbi:hypothetical protein AKO1_003831 [Acrasis kona]|uniref:Uncharacterized protein n=1 Tax=Acrasis kona TaxID=1008807 RepID=A0AAW2Z644_9EUKA